MAETTTESNSETKAPKGEGKSQKSESKPLDSETERVLRGEIADLKEKLRLSEEHASALEGLLKEQEDARAAAKAKKESGPKIPLAKIELLGEGRRVIKRGAQISAAELDGLTEGVHFDYGLLDG